MILNNNYINVFLEDYYNSGESNLLEIADQESMLRKCYDGCFYASFLIDKKGVIIYMNQKAEDAFKITKKDIVGKSINDFESNSIES